MSATFYNPNQMKRFSILLPFFLIIGSCKQHDYKEGAAHRQEINYRQISTPAYELDLPDSAPNAVLVLFGGYPEVAEDIKREFKILEQAKEHKIAIAFSNFNRKLWMEEDELRELADSLKEIFKGNKLPNDNIYLGGFSSGGNVALLIGDYLTENTNLEIAPKGVFAIDPPVDLAALYLSAEKNRQRNFSADAVREGNFLIEMLGARFGNPAKNLEQYEKYAVFTSQTGNVDNIKNLKNTRIRMYTEPDSLWWKDQRMEDYDQMNAFYIKRLSGVLKRQGFTEITYLPTENRGYRANGERHPHSWSIVNADSLITWMLNE